MSKNIIIALIVALNLGLLFQLKKKNKVNQMQHEMIAQTVQNPPTATTSASYIASKYWWEMNSTGDVLPELSLVSDLSEDQDTFQLSELIGDSPKLVLRYSEIHCDVCVDSTLARIKKFADEIGKENILLISSYANPRDMYTFKRLNQIDLPMYNLGEQSLGLSAEQADTPYLFMLSPDQKAEKVFLFYKEIASELDNYFNLLRAKCFHV